MKTIILLSVLVTGCGSLVPYAEIGGGYQINKESDWHLRTEREWQCSNPFVYFEAGYEMKNNWSIGVNHQSHVQCGVPFDTKPETYSLDVRVTKRFGGN